jgi:uncharacterized membrane protein SpoIIM required for sporulation
MYSAVIVIGFFCIAAIVLWRYAAVQPEIRQYRKLQLAKAYWAKMLEQGHDRSTDAGTHRPS